MGCAGTIYRHRGGGVRVGVEYLDLCPRILYNILMAVCSANYGGYVMSDIDLQGCLTIQMFVVEASHTEPDNPDRDRMRKVTLMRRYGVTRSEACDIASRFLRDNALIDERKYQTQTTWRVTEHLFPL